MASQGTIPSAGTAGTAPRKAANSDALQLAEVLAVLRARRRTIRNVALCVIGLSVLVVMLLPTRYTTSAVVMLDQRKNNLTDPSSALSALPTDSASLQNQIQILKSRDLANQVVTRLNLMDDPEFNPAVNAGPVHVFSEILSAANPLHWGGKPAGMNTAEMQRAHVIDNLLDHVSAETIGLSTSIAISVSSSSAEKSARIANAIADTYIDDQGAVQANATERTAEWLSKRSEKLARQVQAAEGAVQKYKAEHNLNETADGTSLADQQLSAISTQLVQARAEYAQKQATNTRAIKQGASGDSADMAAVIASPSIVQLREKEADLAKQEADLATRYGPLHPKMKAIESQKRDLESKINQEVARVSASMANDVAIARANVISLQASLKRAERDAAKQNLARVKLKELQANAASTRAMYEAFVGRLREAQDATAFNGSPARLISHAPVPQSAASPKRKIIVLASIPAGILLGILVALVSERMAPGGATMRVQPPAVRPTNAQAPPRPRHIGEQPRAARAATPLLAEIPDAHRARAADFVIDWPGSQFTHAIAGLARKMTGANVKIIAVTAPDAGPAKTNVALGLARAAARYGKRVVIVDANFRSPSLSYAMGMGAAPAGIIEVLSRRIPLANALVRDPRSPVYALTPTQPRGDSAAVLSSPAMAGMLAQMRKMADIVIVDCPPVFAGNDTQIIAQFADAMLVVTHNDPTHAINTLAHVSTAPAGVVFAR